MIGLSVCLGTQCRSKDGSMGCHDVTGLEPSHTVPTLLPDSPDFEVGVSRGSVCSSRGELGIRRR